MSFITGVSLGQLGCVVETGTTSNTAPTGRYWFAIQVINDARFNTLTNNLATGDALANATSANATPILAGTILYGNFSAFQLHSGAVIAYFGD